MRDLIGDVVARFQAQAKLFDARAAEQHALGNEPSAAAFAAAAADLRATATAVLADTEELGATAYAGLHRTTPQSVRTWCERGQLPGARRAAGGVWRIPRGAQRIITPRAKRAA